MSSLIQSNLKVTLDLDGNKGLKAIRCYYANLIDYFRIILLFASCHYIHALNYYHFYNPNNRFNNIDKTEGTIANNVFYNAFMASLLIFISEMLDWLDGPIARHYKQCSFFGVIMDYAGDVLGEVLILLLFLVSGNLWLLMIKFVFLCVSLSASLIDSVMSFIGTEYLMPSYNNIKIFNKCKNNIAEVGFIPANYSIFWYIMDIELCSVSPTQMKYSNFGCFCWVAYYWWQLSFGVTYILSQHLDEMDKMSNEYLYCYYFYWFERISCYIMFIPCVLEQWLELAYVVLLLAAWREKKMK